MGLAVNGSRQRRRSIGERMTDSEFALSIDALLWISPSGEARDNRENYHAVSGTLDEFERATGLLHNLVETLVPLHSWREHPQLAGPLLEALLFSEASAGQRSALEPEDSIGERNR